ncbi:unnamed protein product [Amoebophrya sp. A120]|nr:unnamed protein product [Amoebophrya sp. A120]|eukprot:GSA120T00006396001.1
MPNAKKTPRETAAAVPAAKNKPIPKTKEVMKSAAKKAEPAAVVADNKSMKIVPPMKKLEQKPVEKPKEDKKPAKGQAQQKAVIKNAANAKKPPTASSKNLQKPNKDKKEDKPKDNVKPPMKMAKAAKGKVEKGQQLPAPGEDADDDKKPATEDDEDPRDDKAHGHEIEDDRQPEPDEKVEQQVEDKTAAQQDQDDSDDMKIVDVAPSKRAEHNDKPPATTNTKPTGISTRPEPSSVLHEAATSKKATLLPPVAPVSSTDVGTGASSGSEQQKQCDLKTKLKLRTMDEPVFPPAERLLPLHSGPDDVPMCDADKHDKKAETEEARRINGWSTHRTRQLAQDNKKSEIISDLLARWWFVFPQWPPENYDYKTALKKKGYREVPVASWLQEKPVDVTTGLAKVYQLESFPGCFRNGTDHGIIDLRPAKSCPCFLNLQKLSVQKLIFYLKRAYENQMLVLRQVGGDANEKLIKEIAKDLRDLVTANATKYDNSVSAPYKKQIATHLKKLYED